eukprot:8309642-Ditylum_brightwellii.AAC.1
MSPATLHLFSTASPVTSLMGYSCSPCAEVGQVQGGQSDSYVHLLGDVKCHYVNLLRRTHQKLTVSCFYI